MKKIFLLFCFIPGICWALLPFAPSDAEQKMLPIYCQEKLSGKKPSSTVMSEVVYLHHYCFGLNFLNRSNKYGSGDKRYNLGKAVAEMSSSIGRNNKNNPFMPEMLNQLAKAKEKQKNVGEAEKLYLEAINLNRSYTKSYGNLSNLYKRQGNLEDALEVINKGLEHNPESKYLKKKLKRINKKLKALN